MAYPLIVSPGEWLEYEIVKASNFQLLPGVAVQQGDKVRFEIVGGVVGKRMGLDMTTAVSFETPLYDAYLNGEKTLVRLRIPQGQGGILGLPSA